MRTFFIPLRDWLRRLAVRAAPVMAGGALLLHGPAPGAVEMPDLFQAEIPVPSKSDAERPEAFRRGLERVLGRVVRAEDLNSAAVRTLQAKPENLLLEYSYPGASVNGQPLLRMEFDGEDIRAKLRARGIGVFGPSRPRVVAWISLEDGQPARLLAADAPEWEPLLRALADQHGLPLTPAGNPADQQAVSPGDIAVGNAERLLAASERYEPEAILTGRLIQRPEGYDADWRLYRGDQDQRWAGKSADLTGILDSGVSGAYARVANAFIAQGGGTTPLTLQIGGIASLDDVNRVTAYLGKLSPVAKAEMLSLEPDGALFKLSVRGGRELFEETLATGNRLRPEGGSPGSGALRYRLAR